MRFFIDLNVIIPKFVPYHVHDACAVLCRLSHNEFGYSETNCINTHAFVIQVRDVG